MKNLLSLFRVNIWNDHPRVFVVRQSFKDWYCFDIRLWQRLISCSLMLSFYSTNSRKCTRELFLSSFDLRFADEMVLEVVIRLAIGRDSSVVCVIRHVHITRLVTGVWSRTTAACPRARNIIILTYTQRASCAEIKIKIQLLGFNLFLKTYEFEHLLSLSEDFLLFSFTSVQRWTIDLACRSFSML